MFNIEGNRFQDDIDRPLSHTDFLVAIGSATPRAMTTGEFNLTDDNNAVVTITIPAPGLTVTEVRILPQARQVMPSSTVPTPSPTTTVNI